MSTGTIVQVIGPVVDVRFPAGELPEIYNALKMKDPKLKMKDPKLTLEVQQHLGDNTVRTVALGTVWKCPIPVRQSRCLSVRRPSAAS